MTPNNRFGTVRQQEPHPSCEPAVETGTRRARTVVSRKTRDSDFCSRPGPRAPSAPRRRGLPRRSPPPSGHHRVVPSARPPLHLLDQGGQRGVEVEAPARHERGLEAREAVPPRSRFCDRAPRIANTRRERTADDKVQFSCLSAVTWPQSGPILQLKVATGCNLDHCKPAPYPSSQLKFDAGSPPNPFRQHWPKIPSIFGAKVPPSAPKVSSSASKPHHPHRSFIVGAPRGAGLYR